MRFLQTISILGLCLMVSGCGSKHGNRPAVHPVQGKLLVGGKPAANAEVMLYPNEAKKSSLLRPHATVGADGSYYLTTFATRDGRPVGDFAVTVVWPGPPGHNQGEDEPGPDRLGRRYADAKKPATTVHIGPETTELATIDLKPVEENPKRAVDSTPSTEQ